MSLVDEINQYIIDIRPWVEKQVDEQIINSEPDLETKMIFLRNRDRIIHGYLEAVRRKNLEVHLAEAEGRLRPKLVET
jgi:hypothetical protein